MNKKDRSHYIETDDSCAICGSRGLNILSEHHIDSNKSNTNYDNCIVLCHNCHHAYHNHKGLSLAEIKRRKKHLIQKTITTYGLNAMRIAERNNGVVALPFLLHHLISMGYMTQEEGIMDYGSEIMDATARFAITDSGRALLKKWFG